MTPARSPATLASARAVRVFDVAAVVWVVLWLVVGVWSGVRLTQLSQVADNVARTARGLRGAGLALENLGGLPLVGSAARRAGQEISDRATGVITSARGDAQAMRELGALVGVAIAAGPSLGVVGLYLPARLAYAREVRAVSRAVGDDAGQAEQMLAVRAVHNLPLETLRRVSAHPLADLRDGRFRDLAGAEAARLGVRWPPDGAGNGPRSASGPPGSGAP